MQARHVAAVVLGVALCACRSNSLVLSTTSSTPGVPPSPAATDTTPDAFAFTAQSNAQPSTAVTSNTISVSGVNADTAISIAGGTYSVGCGTSFTSSASTVANGQTVCVQVTSSSSFGGTVAATLTIGGVAANFNVTTRNLDTTPDAFTFTPQPNVPQATQVQSNTVTISGLEVGVAVNVSGGEYSIGCTGTFTTGPGTIDNGQTVCVRNVSASAPATGTTTTLTVGTASVGFTDTTQSALVWDQGKWEQTSWGS